MHATESHQGQATVSIWRWMPWLAAGALLLAPWVAMQFTAEVNWSAMDFLVMGALLAAVCSGFELARRRSDEPLYLAACGIALLTGFMTIWINLAVGIFGDGHDHANLLFAGVLGVALGGAALGGLRAPNLASVTAVAAAVQAAIGAWAWMFRLNVEAVVLSFLFAAVWLFAAWLFRKAAAGDPAADDFLD
ncbi:MAG: hypothetical protein KDJ14_13250 [Xanthomonadales bacterium]|nr:hypothetical protein [Xanthomonadales bacterium]